MNWDVVASEVTHGGYDLTLLLVTLAILGVWTTANVGYHYLRTQGVL